MGQYDCYNSVMSKVEISLSKKIADFVNRDNAYKNFDEQVHERVLGQKNLKGNEIKIICDTRCDAYIVNDKAFRRKR